MVVKCKFNENDEKCSVQASYGSPTDRKVLFCKLHKAEDHIDLRSQKCQHVEKGIRCSIQASFGSEKDKKKLYCCQHKRKGDVDLKSQRCDYKLTNGKQCKKQATYKGIATMRCGDHRLKDGKQFRSKLCSYVDPETKAKCKLTANFGSEKREFCSRHKSAQDEHLAGHNCQNCKVTEAHYGKNNKREYCAPCFAELFPESVQGRIYLVKQKTIVEVLKKNFTIASVDKIIKGGKSKRRPDIVIDCGSFVIVIEIDELQHNNGKYNPELDEIRNNEIYEDLGCRPVVFIRFNPDKYTVGLKKFKGCFDSKSEVDEKIFNKRMSTLVSHVKNIQQNAIKDDEKIIIQYL